MSFKPNSFGRAREKSLKAWLNGTSRQLVRINSRQSIFFDVDIFHKSFECRWQGRAGKAAKKNDWHVPHFCSLGEWASGITDLLLQEHLDDLCFSFGANLREEDKLLNNMLWRQYTRILLLVEQICGDLISLHREVTGETASSIRKKLSKIITQEQLFGFINNVCKHKDGNKSKGQGFHSHNHHLPLYFLDSNSQCNFKNAYSILKVSHANNSTPDGIVVPKLIDIIQTLVESYESVDLIFKNSHVEFDNFCIKSGKVHT